jgi:hypothetical protein
MAFGTAMGGWRIVKTMGMRLTKLRPVGGFCAEVAGAITLFVATHFKIPVSDHTHHHRRHHRVGSTTKVRGIRWGLASRIVWAWIFTIPMSAGMSAATLLSCTACTSGRSAPHHRLPGLKRLRTPRRSPPILEGERDVAVAQRVRPGRDRDRPGHPGGRDGAVRLAGLRRLPALAQPDRPALEAVAAGPDREPLAAPVRRVVIIIIDGLRLKSSYGFDLLDQLRATASTRWRARTTRPTRGPITSPS